jgi:hypothetical protein
MVTNGQIDLRQLQKIDATHYLSPGCARAWAGFASELGLTVGNAADSCYRTLGWQQYRYAHRPPAASYPGTSNHGLGQAIDIGNYYRYSHTTLVRVGRQYGFVFDTGSEPWHIKYVGSPNYYPLAATGTGNLTRNISEGIDMDIMWMVNTTSRSGVYKNGDFYSEKTLGAPLVKVGNAEYQARAQILRGLGVSDSASPLAFRYTIHGDELEKLASVRGVATKV